MAGRGYDPGWRMQLPLAVLTAAIVALGVYSVPLVRFLTEVASGLH